MTIAKADRDPVRVNAEILRRRDQSFLALIAATAAFALNAGLWFRRGRPAMGFCALAA